MNKQTKLTETNILYRAIVLGALVWGVIYLTLVAGTLWLIVPVVGVYSLMALLPLETTWEKLLKRRKKKDIGDTSLPNSLYEMQRTDTTHLSLPTGANGENLQDKDQSTAQTPKKNAA